MKLTIVLVAITTFLFLITFPTTTVGKNMRFWPNKPTKGWPYPSRISRNTAHRTLNYVQDSKVWKCTYSNGSSPAISISPSSPSSPSPPTSPKTSPPPPTPSPPPPPPTPKTSPPPPSPSPPPPTPSPPPPTPKTSPPPPTPSPPPATPKTSPSPPKPSYSPPPTPKTSPSPPKHSLPPPPKEDESSSPPSEPSKPTPPKEPNHHHHHHDDENPWEHVGTCMRNMGRVRMCRGEMEMSFYTRMFRVSDYCCNLVVNMKNECDDVVWGFFTDPFFVPLVRCTCHVNLLA